MNIYIIVTAFTFLTSEPTICSRKGKLLLVQTTSLCKLEKCLFLKAFYFHLPEIFPKSYSFLQGLIYELHPLVLFSANPAQWYQTGLLLVLIKSWKREEEQHISKLNFVIALFLPFPLVTTTLTWRQTQNVMPVIRKSLPYSSNSVYFWEKAVSECLDDHNKQQANKFAHKHTFKNQTKQNTEDIPVRSGIGPSFSAARLAFMLLSPLLEWVLFYHFGITMALQSLEPKPNSVCMCGRM